VKLTIRKLERTFVVEGFLHHWRQAIRQFRSRFLKFGLWIDLSEHPCARVEFYILGNGVVFLLLGFSFLFCIRLVPCTFIMLFTDKQAARGKLLRYWLMMPNTT
jgi:hypothetical protein